MSHKNIQDYPNISVAVEAVDGPVSWEQLFCRPGPVHIEVGSGRGTFLLAAARSQPAVNFLGIEWASRFYRYAVDRMGRQGIENVRLIRTDACWFIRQCVADGTVDRFHIYFPDPWPKKRHNRRRFFNDANLLEMTRCLRSGGLINAATDHTDYFRQMCSALDRRIQDGLLGQAGFVRPAGAIGDELVGTNYERKYLKEGRCTYTIAARKL